MDASLEDASLLAADLTEANLTDADLIDVGLIDADLTGAYLRGAHLTDEHRAAAGWVTNSAQNRSLVNDLSRGDRRTSPRRAASANPSLSCS